ARADARLLLLRRDPRVPLPRRMVPVPALGGELLARPPAIRRRHRVLRARRRLRLRPAHRVPVRGQAAPPPTLVSFERHVRAALDSLPPELARGLENVAVVVEEYNRDDPDLYGLFEEQPYMPARIAIYRRPLVEDFGDDPRALEEEIRITVLHELAHYFGIDEDRLDELGYA